MIVTTSESEETCAQALYAGADDYVVKRRPTEFAARVAALLRRVKDPNDELVTAGDITIDLRTRDVWVRSRRVRLRPHEFDLLCDLARHPSMVRSYRTLLAVVWGSIDSDCDLTTYACVWHTFDVRSSRRQSIRSIS